MKVEHIFKYNKCLLNELVNASVLNFTLSKQLPRNFFSNIQAGAIAP
jgi:hypothetical protein